MMQRRRARGLLVTLGCVTVMAGFMACSGSSTKRTGRNNYQGNGGDSAQTAGAGGAPTTDAGGSSSTVTAGSGGVAGEGGNAAVAGESFGGAPGVTGGAAGAATGATGGMGEGGTGATSVGGESNVGGESSVGGQAQGGAGGEGGQPFVDPICGVNMVQVGAYSLWCGKVNMHLTDQGTWTHDADCSSGCNVAGVTYCQKFYPTATAVATVPQVDVKDWKNAGCAESTPDGAGVSGEAACCAPMP